MALKSDFPIQALTPQCPSEIGAEQLRLAKAVAAEPSKAPRGPRKVAILVSHGMGQQVPYETLSLIGQALQTQHAATHKIDSASLPPVGVRRVKLTDTPDAMELSRAELRFHSGSDDSEAEAEVHVYESYWAPLTEGQISFVQTAAFLYMAAWNGLRTYFKSSARREASGANQRARTEGGKYFDRWMFGDFRDMKISSSTFWLLAAAVAVISLLLIPAASLFTPLGWSALKWLLARYQSGVEHGSLILKIAIAIAAVVFVGLAIAVRYFVVEYVGDVAIYVSSYKVSRFDAIRNAILTTACGVARQIYSAGIADSSHERYDRVIIVGHSLGSVISYDALNYSINWDQVECNFSREVVGRTRRLITFGSPLDKTAFLFRTQVSDARNLREALAARQQPLILDYQQFRPSQFRWINIYSPADVISGNLDYYDYDKAPGYIPVHNEIDPQATTPIWAHVQYWDDELLHKRLYESVWA